MEENKKERNYKIDFLRVLGTFLVILAHVSLPSILSQIRSFDVVMLVFISGMSYAYHPQKGIKYIFKRIKKLLFPTYFVITFIFALSFVVCFALRRTQLFDFVTILKSYLFYGGMGYIWIVKVYLGIAILLPFIYAFSNFCKSDYLFWITIIALYFLYHYAAKYLSDIPFLYQYIFEVFPYVLIASLGMRMASSPKKVLLLIAAFLFLFLISVAREGNFSPETFKYPAFYQYISYGILMSLLLYLLVPNKENRIVAFLSKSSFKIYLIHIVFLMTTNVMSSFSLFGFLKLWYIQYPIIVLFSIAFVLLHDFIVNKIFSNTRIHHEKKVNS